MSNNVELGVIRYNGYGMPKETLELLISYMPDGELIPFAVQSEDEEPVTVFGFSTDAITDKINETNIDAFNMMVLNEARRPIPVGKHKVLRLMNVNIVIMG